MSNPVFRGRFEAAFLNLAANSSRACQPRYSDMEGETGRGWATKYELRSSTSFSTMPHMHSAAMCGHACCASTAPFFGYRSSLQSWLRSQVPLNSLNAEKYLMQVHWLLEGTGPASRQAPVKMVLHPGSNGETPPSSPVTWFTVDISNLVEVGAAASMHCGGAAIAPILNLK